MARKRVARGAGVKAKVALAALSGGSPTQVASRFGVHPTQVATWKKRLVEGAEELFADQRRKKPDGADEQELYEQIGRLQMELAWLKKKVAQTDSFTVADTASIVMAVAESLLECEPLKRLKLLFITKKLTDCLRAEVVPVEPAKAKPKKSKPRDTVYQFKITLLGTKPPIWRRIQVKDCTLDKLHEHIQTAMGWTNSHLHQFDINDERYGDPELLDDGFEGFECVDSTKTNLSQVLPKTSERFGFKYEYDYGDS